MYLKRFSVLAMAFVVLLVSACGAIGHLRNAGAVYEGWKSYGMVKELSAAVPVMYNIDAVRVDTRIAPRDESTAETVSAAFDENAHFLVEEALEATGIDVPVCFDDCPDLTLLIQFRETGFDRSFAERVVMGSRLRGDVYFIDSRDNEVLDTVDLQSSHDYTDVAGGLQDVIVMRALTSRRYQLEARRESGDISDERAGEIMKAHVDAVNSIESVRADLRAVLETG